MLSNHSFSASKEDLQEALLYMFTELKSSGFSVNQSKLRDSFALSISNNQKWSSLLASMNGIKRFEFDADQAVQNSYFNKHTVISLKEVAEILRRKHPLESIVYEDLFQLFPNELSTKENNGQKEVNSLIRRMSLGVLKAFLSENVFSSSRQFNILTVWLDVDEISQEAFEKRFLQTKSDIYFSNDDESFYLSRILIEDFLNNTEFSNEYDHKPLKLLELIEKLRENRTPKFLFMPFEFNGIEELYLKMDFYNSDFEADSAIEYVGEVTGRNPCECFGSYASLLNNGKNLTAEQLSEEILSSCMDAVEKVTQVISDFCTLIDSFDEIGKGVICYSNKEIAEYWKHWKEYHKKRYGHVSEINSVLNRLPENPSETLYQAFLKTYKESKSFFINYALFDYYSDNFLLGQNSNLKIDMVNDCVKYKHVNLESIYTNSTDAEKNEFNEKFIAFVELIASNLSEAFGYKFVVVRT